MSRKLVIVSARSIPPKMLEKGVASRRLVTGPKDGSDRFMLSLLRIASGMSTKGAYNDKDEGIYLLKGRLTLRWEDQETVVGPGQAVFIPMGLYLEMANEGEGPVELLAVISPSKTAEEL